MLAEGGGRLFWQVLSMDRSLCNDSWKLRFEPQNGTKLLYRKKSRVGPGLNESRTPWAPFFLLGVKALFLTCYSVWMPPEELGLL